MRHFVLAAAMLGGFAAATPASALTMANPLAAEAGQSRADAVAWYCGPRGHCVQGPRRGYVARSGWQPSCRPGFRWNGYDCVPRRGGVVLGVPGVSVRIR